MNQATPISAEAFASLLRARRSVFIDQFEAGARIDDDIVYQVLQSANYAPTHKLTEPWRFTVFCNQGLMKLASLQANYYREHAGEKFKQATYDKLLSNPARCSHVVAIGLKRHESVPEVEEIAALGCAMENIYLSMTVHGIGGYWSTGGVTYYKGAQQLFGLNENDKLMGFLFMGIIKSPSVSREPGDFADKITWISE